MFDTLNWNRPCSVCNSNNKKLLFRQKFKKFNHIGLLAGYDVVVCDSCGFCYADHLPDQSEFDAYYRDMSKYEHQDRHGEPSEFETRQFPMLVKFIQEHLADSHARILEIGCANGGLLHALKGAGYQNIFGIDPSPTCATFAHDLYDIRIDTGTIADIDIKCGPFDFIIMVAVLEHIRDLDHALEKLHYLLSTEGKVYIEVPDATKFATSPDAPYQEFSGEHINFFSSVSLANLMGANGFTEIYSTPTCYEQTDTHKGYAIRAIYKYGESDSVFLPITDYSSEIGLNAYIQASYSVESHIHAVVRMLVNSQEPLIVWGVGTHTQRLLATSELATANIVAFVDSNPNYQGKRLHNITIMAPEELAATTASVLVSSKVFQSEIVHIIRLDLNLKNRIITLYDD